MISTALCRAWNWLPRLVAAMAITVALATARPAGALPAYLTAFEAQYPAAAGSRIDSCNLCHTEVPALNPYGTAFAASGHEFAPIEGVDSDGDGFSNLAEIEALTFPGDPGDTPVVEASPTATALAETPTATPEEAPTFTPTGASTESPTEGPTNTPGTPTPTGGEVPTATPTGGVPTGSPTVAATNTSGSRTPTAVGGSPTVTRPATTPTAGTPSVGSPTPSRTGTRARTAAPSNEDDGCNIVAPERSSSGGALALLLAPALLLWARRRR